MITKGVSFCVLLAVVQSAASSWLTSSLRILSTWIKNQKANLTQYAWIGRIDQIQQACLVPTIPKHKTTSCSCLKLMRAFIDAQTTLLVGFMETYE